MLMHVITWTFGLVKAINLHFSKAKAFYTYSTYLQRTVFCQASTLAELLLVVEVLRDLKHLSIFFRVVKTLPGIRFLSLPNLRLTGFNGNFVCDDFFRQTHPNSVEMRMNHFVKSEFWLLHYLECASVSLVVAELVMLDGGSIVADEVVTIAAIWRNILVSISTSFKGTWGVSQLSWMIGTLHMNILRHWWQPCLYGGQ